MNIKITPADRWFSLCARTSASWTDQMDGRRFPPGHGGLHTCHIWSRRHRSTRFHPLNILILSFGNHAKYDQDHHLHRDFAIKIHGQENYDYITELHNRVVKFSKADLRDVGEFYRELAKTMQRGDPLPISPTVERLIR